MSFIDLLSKEVVLPADGIIDVEGAAQMSASGAGPYRYSFNLLIDGVLVWNPGGATPLDVVYMGGFLARPAGTYTIVLRVTADTSLTVGKAFLKIRSFPKASGE